MKTIQRFACSLALFGLFACAPEKVAQEKVAPVENVPNPGAKSVPIPATGLRLVPPAGWIAAEEFVGFMSEETRGSIMITEIPGPFAEISNGFKQKEVMAKSGMELLSSEEFDQGLYPGILFRASQEVYGTQVEKWGWVFGNGAESLLLMGTCYETSDLPAVKASIESAEWDPQVEYEEPGGIGFAIEPGKLVLAERVGKMLLYTSTGKLDPEKKGLPMFMFGPAMGSGPILDHKEFAEQRIRDLPYENSETRSSVAVEIDGLPGYTFVASVSQESSSLPMVIHMTLLFEESNYWILMGSCDAKVEAEFLPVFDAASKSFHRTR